MQNLLMRYLVLLSALCRRFEDVLTSIFVITAGLRTCEPGKSKLFWTNGGNAHGDDQFETDLVLVAVVPRRNTWKRARKSGSISIGTDISGSSSSSFDMPSSGPESSWSAASSCGLSMFLE